MVRRNMKRCSESLVIRKMQSKTVSYHFIRMNLVKIEKLDNAKCEHVCVRHAGKKEPSHATVGC